MSELTSLFTNLSLDETKILFIDYDELEISQIKNYNLVEEFYKQINKLRTIMHRGCILNNKDLIIGLLRFNWIYDKMIEGILRISLNYSQDICTNGLDKLTPNFFLDWLKSNISSEQYNLISNNFFYYKNKFFI